ncbi:MAG: EhaG family protein [Methanomicrobiales archaeon]|nr:EhaG family protein [Methanomicrobiales archaeon]
MMEEYQIGLMVGLIAIIITFYAVLREKNDIHRLILVDLGEVSALAIIALVATDLAEALIIPGLVVGISELLAVSEVYLVREGLNHPVKQPFRIEILDTAPTIVATILVLYGIVLSGFTGGAVAGTGMVFYFVGKKTAERFELIETISGYAWAFWIVAFFIFMVLPEYWFFAVMLAGGAILAKVTAKMSLVGTMWGEKDV